MGDHDEPDSTRTDTRHPASLERLASESLSPQSLEYSRSQHDIRSQHRSEAEAEVEPEEMQLHEDTLEDTIEVGRAGSFPKLPGMSPRNLDSSEHTPTPEPADPTGQLTPYQSPMPGISPRGSAFGLDIPIDSVSNDQQSSDSSAYSTPLPKRLRDVGDVVESWPSSLEKQAKRPRLSSEEPTFTKSPSLGVSRVVTTTTNANTAAITLSPRYPLGLLNEQDFEKIESPIGWLNDQAMNYLASSFVSHRPHWRMMDSLIPYAFSPLTKSRHWEFSCIRGCNDAKAVSVILPLHLPPHWVCSVYHKGVWRVADSLGEGSSSVARCKEILTKVDNLIPSLGPGPAPITTDFITCSQQSNANDCGIFTLVHILIQVVHDQSVHAMPPISLASDMGLWRRILGYLARISHGSDERSSRPKFVLDEDLAQSLPRPQPDAMPALPKDDADWTAWAQYHTDSMNCITRAISEHLPKRLTRHSELSQQFSQARKLLNGLRELNAEADTHLAKLCDTVSSDIDVLKSQIQNLTVALGKCSSYITDPVKQQMLESQQNIVRDIQRRLDFWEARRICVNNFSAALEKVCEILKEDDARLKKVTMWIRSEGDKLSEWLLR